MKKLGWAVLLINAAAITWYCWPYSPTYAGPVSDHFDGERFFDPDASFNKSWTDLWRFYRERDPGQWTRDLQAPTGPAPPQRAADGALRATFIGHATVLIQADGLNILTDPIWSERGSPLSFAGPRRFTPPAIAFDDLPPIDYVLISHNHYDHLDLPTLMRLREHFDPVFVVGLGQSALLHSKGIERAQELDWWQPLRLPNGCKLWGAPARHWSQRLGAPRNQSLWLSYVLQTLGGPVYFAGDTGYSQHFSATRERFGPMRYAFLPIGAYKPRWLTDYQHMDPVQSVRAHQDLDSQASMAVHFGTFELADDGQHESVDDLVQARGKAGLETEAFIAPTFGQGYDVPSLTSTSGCAS